MGAMTAWLFIIRLIVATFINDLAEVDRRSILSLLQRAGPAAAVDALRIDQKVMPGVWVRPGLFYQVEQAFLDRFNYRRNGLACQ